MTLNLHILGEFSRKALYVALTLLIGLSMSTGNVLANSCKGGAECLSCMAVAHPHVPGMDVEMVNRDCESTAQNSSCSLETGHGLDEFDRIATVTESSGKAYSGIFSAASGEFEPLRLYPKFLTQNQYPHRGDLTPIYLRNHSLLC